MKWEPAKSSSGPGKKGKGRGLLIAIVVIVAIVVVGGISRCGGGEKDEPLNWPSEGLATKLPKPSSDKGEINADTDEEFRADVNGFSHSDYEAYVEQCKELGFTVDADESFGFEAYSEEGYFLNLYYYESSEEMSISLDAPAELGAISWPTMGAGALIPAPVSTTGKIDSDSSTFFSATVGETSLEDFSAYVDSCIAAGFNVDYNKSDESFYGDDAGGNHVSVNYKGANMMSITVNATDETEPEAPVETTEPEATPEPEPALEPEAPAEPEPTSGATSGSADFRAMVDEYEAFMNKYCDFMETYSSDSGNVVSMAIDYASMMAQYGEWAEKIDAVDESTLSAEDDLYFLDAQTRINQRLLSIGLS